MAKLKQEIKVVEESIKDKMLILIKTMHDEIQIILKKKEQLMQDLAIDTKSDYNHIKTLAKHLEEITTEEINKVRAFYKEKIRELF